MPASDDTGLKEPLADDTAAPPSARSAVRAKVERIEASAYKIPTDGPEADGTLSWDSTTIVVVRAHAGGIHGLGYSYGHQAAAQLVASKLAGIVTGEDAMAVTQCWGRMMRELRNIGTRGIGAMAISAVDGALCDLKARLLGLPLATLLGAVREAVPVYGSGGFTSYSIERLQEQLGGWAAQGIAMVKMKVGSEPG